MLLFTYFYLNSRHTEEVVVGYGDSETESDEDNSEDDDDGDFDSVRIVLDLNSCDVIS